MTTFYIIVGIMLMVAVGILAPTLLFTRRVDTSSRVTENVTIARERLAELGIAHDKGDLGDAEYEQARTELEKSLAGDLDQEAGEASGKGGLVLLLILLVALPLGSLALYRHYGAPQHIDLVGPGEPAQRATPEKPSVEEMLTKLEQRLQANPDDADGWYMLGRSYMALGRFEDAVKAYEELHRIVGDHPAALVSLADAIAMTQDGKLLGRPEALALKALEVSPEDPTANWLAGKAAAERGDATAAIAYWREAAKGLAERPELLAEIDRLIQETATAAGIEAAPLAKTAAVEQPADAQAPAPAAAAGPAAIKVKVSLDPALADKVSPDDVLFIFARAEQGPPMPLAVSRLRAGDLPVEVTLDDSMAMMPQLKLSGFQQVKVGARISRSGQPIAQPGDLQSESRVVKVGADSMVSLVVNSTVP